MISRKRSSRREPAKPSFQQQLARLAKSAKKESSPKPGSRTASGQVVVQPPPPVSFRDLVQEVSPLRGAQERVPLDHLPPPPEPVATVRLPPRQKLWVEENGARVRAAAPGIPERVLRELELGRFLPRAEVDLHRHNVDAARAAIDEAIYEGRRRGLQCIMVVVGRGTHSGHAGAVLPEFVVRHVCDQRGAEVRAMCTAPRRWGGIGAFLLLLAPHDPSEAG